jgi:hypothetical protein
MHTTSANLLYRGAAFWNLFPHKSETFASSIAIWISKPNASSRRPNGKCSCCLFTNSKANLSWCFNLPCFSETLIYLWASARVPLQQNTYRIMFGLVYCTRSNDSGLGPWSESFADKQASILIRSLSQICCYQAWTRSYIALRSQTDQI